MLEPYAAPAADTDIDIEAGSPRARWELPILCVLLGVGWWIALLIPESSRSFLLTNDSLDSPIISVDALPPTFSPLALLWGFMRVVAIVGGACWLYAALHRRFRKLRWLTALVCLWGGSGLFAMSAGPLGLESISVALVAPAIFIVLAWYVAIPMTILTAIVLTNRLDERR
jgi:hypothetical protein